MRGKSCAWGIVSKGRDKKLVKTKSGKIFYGCSGLLPVLHEGKYENLHPVLKLLMKQFCSLIGNQNKTKH